MKLSTRFRQTVWRAKRYFRAKFLTSTSDKVFLETVGQWCKIQNEVLVLIEYPYGAGSTSWEFFSSPAAIFERLHQLQRRTRVTIFKQRQLPLRGIVNDTFIDSCMQAIPEGVEFLVAETVQRTAGTRSWFHNDGGVLHAELFEALDDSRGTPVAVGVYPNRLAKSPDVLIAYVPDEDGVVRPAAY